MGWGWDWGWGLSLGWGRVFFQWSVVGWGSDGSVFVGGGVTVSGGRSVAGGGGDVLMRLVIGGSRC